MIGPQRILGSVQWGLILAALAVALWGYITTGPAPGHAPGLAGPGSSWLWWIVCTLIAVRVTVDATLLMIHRDLNRTKS